MNAKYLMALTVLLITGTSASAKRVIRINENVTTHLVMPEDLRLVDISTSKIVGNQCTDNIVRIKPCMVEDSIGEIDYYDGEMLGTITLIGERHMTQYELAYATNARSAATIIEVPYAELDSYINPQVSMPKSEMARYAWAIYGSKRKFNQIVSNENGIKATVNNIYSVGDYFFIDYTLKNKSRIAYDIEEVRVKLTDKKELKSTNSQTIELTPVFSLNNTPKFKKSYRNVLVIDKLTFPDEKVLKIEISENQISGRVIEMTIEYDDILNADGFDSDILEKTPYTYHIYENANAL